MICLSLNIHQHVKILKWIYLGCQFNVSGIRYVILSINKDYLSPKPKYCICRLFRSSTILIFVQKSNFMSLSFELLSVIFSPNLCCVKTAKSCNIGLSKNTLDIFCRFLYFAALLCVCILCMLNHDKLKCQIFQRYLNRFYLTFLIRDLVVTLNENHQIKCKIFLC